MMSQIILQFDESLSSVSAQHARVTIDHLQQESDAENPGRDAKAIATLDAIESRFEDFEQAMSRRLDQMKEEIAHLAIGVAKSVLNEDEELIQRRVQQYVDIAFEQSQSPAEKTIHVHPSCAGEITRWVKQSGLSEVEIRPDASVSPGDCRVESEDSGVAATLDAHLDAIFQRLKGISS